MLTVKFLYTYLFEYEVINLFVFSVERKERARLKNVKFQGRGSGVRINCVMLLVHLSGI